MPELPEVETMRRGILPVVGARITEFERLARGYRPIAVKPGPAAWRRRVVGQTITAIGRVGKRVVIELGSGDRIVIEPRMTGLVLLAEPPTPDHLRVRFRLTERKVPELLFWDRRGLGSIYLLSPDEFASRFAPQRIGPDALTVDAGALRARLAGSQRAIKVALLDQKALAGVGNLYASEMLFVAGIHPEARCHRLRPADWQRLAEAMRSVLEEAIRHEGSTLSDGTYRNALNQAGSYQNCHRVYDRADETCRGCQVETIRRIVQAQRSTFFCPRCQPRTPRRVSR